MCSHMSRSRRGVLVAAVVVACLLLVASAALAKHSNQGDNEPANGPQAQVERPGRGHAGPAGRPPVLVLHQREKPSHGPVQRVDSSRTQPSSNVNRWQPPRGNGRWERSDSNSGAGIFQGRPVTRNTEAWRPTISTPEGNQNRSPWLYRRGQEERVARETPARRDAPPSNARWTSRQNQRAEGPKRYVPRADANEDRWNANRPAPRGNGNREAAGDPGRFITPSHVNRNREEAAENSRPQNARPTGGRQHLDESAIARIRQRQERIPTANFRGPEAEKRISMLPAGEGERVRREFRARVREMNLKHRRPHGKPKVDVVGNIVPPNAKLIVRTRTPRVSVSYRNIYVSLGDPVYDYVFLPRTAAAYWDGYWDGYSDGYWAGQHYYRHTTVVLNFYYPYYYSDPQWVAFWYADLYPSVYHYWGWSPGWIFPERAYYAPVEYVYVPRTPYRYYGYRLDEAGAERAIEDIRRAWLRSDIDLLAYHLTDQQDIQVYFDGKYEYTTSTGDYYAMTADAMATTATVALDFNRPIWISSHEIFVTGRHVFYDPEGMRNTVYVSYRLRRLGSEWYIVAIGSSLEPIRHKYRDFRYS